MDQAFLGPGSANAGILDLSQDLGADLLIGNEDTSLLTGKDPINTAASLLTERLAGMDESIDTGVSLNMLFASPIINEQGARTSDDIQAAGDDSAQPVQNLPRLTAVMPASNGGAAVLDGVLVRAGGISADGFRLITVRHRSVTLQRDGRTYSIEVPITGG